MEGLELSEPEVQEIGCGDMAQTSEGLYADYLMLGSQKLQKSPKLCSDIEKDKTAPPALMSSLREQIRELEARPRAMRWW